MARLTRYLVPQVRRDLLREMVFVAGPRQVGKTTLARSLPGAKASTPVLPRSASTGSGAGTTSAGLLLAGVTGRSLGR